MAHNCSWLIIVQVGTNMTAIVPSRSIFLISRHGRSRQVEISRMDAPEKIFQKAVSALNQGDVAEAERLFKKVLQSKPNHIAALNLLTVLLMRTGRFAEAEPVIAKAISLGPESDAAYYNFGLILKRLNKPTQALQQFNKALSLNSVVPETWNNRGTVFNDLRQYTEATVNFDRAISLQPSYSEAYVNKAKSLAGLKRYDDAFTAYDKALALKPDLAEAWLGRGTLLAELNRCNEAFAAYDKALALKPDLAETWLGYGQVFLGLRRYDEAFAAYDKALALNSDLAEAWLGHGRIFLGLRRFDEAIAPYDKALALKPDLALAWLGRGTALHELKRFDEAIDAYDQALKLRPDIEYAEGARLSARMSSCDWANIELEILHFLSAVTDQKLVSAPFTLLAMPTSSADQLQVAKTFVADQVPFPALRRGEIYSHDRIRIGYFSADFRQHPVAHLAVGLFEKHDKSRFEITAISFGPDDGSDLRSRIKSAVENFVDVGRMPDLAVAEFIRDREIDVIVDLMGLTENCRFSVLSRRVAPIQVNFLGYPGTMGADFMDYIIADATIIPKDHFRFYSEQVVWLPDTHQPNDNKRPISERLPTRAECNLPEAAFVFCCFNGSYKITPAIFDLWMRLLRAVPNSVLWLSKPSPTAEANLGKEAELRGVSRGRIVFAPRFAEMSDHLARQRQADLFLDTLPYNAHTTASDALWAGLPVLTCTGETFAGRVAASLLRAVGLPELVTMSLEDYEALALKLAHDLSFLQAIKAKLVRNRNIYPLFDTARFTRHLEAAYGTMWERYQRREEPQAFAVAPID